MDQQVVSQESNNNIEYATFNRRMIASTIDTILLFILLLVAFKPLEWLVYGDDTLLNILSRMGNNVEPSILAAELSKYKIIQKILFMNFISLVVIGWILTWFWRKHQNTPGKFIARCKIVDEQTLNGLSNKQCIVRFLGYIVSSIPLCLGFFAVYWDKKSRAWHDRIAGTVVIVDKSAMPELSDMLKGVFARFTKKL